MIDAGFTERLFEQLQAVHRAGFIWRDVRYGNVLIEQEKRDPYLIDFDSTYDHSRTWRPLLRILCDQNIEEFNRCFGTDKPTYVRVKRKTRLRAAPGSGRGADGYHRRILATVFAAAFS